MPGDRREYQRLRLPKPLPGILDGQGVLVLDMGVGGALLEHQSRAEPGRQVQLVIPWVLHEIEYEAEVVRSEIVRTRGSAVVSHTGVQFLRPVGNSDRLLTDMMATFVGEVLSLQKLNASGERTDGEDPLAALGGARRSRSHGYVTFDMDESGTWHRFNTISPQQPENGFTVARYEDEEELRVLCRAWEIGDAEARQLIRLVAAMSARTVEKV